ncbi:MAG: response regulator [Actinomycetota bacterium]
MEGKPRVLIADDNPDILILLRTNLRAAGFESIEAGNGQVALERIEQDRPDIVLLDLMMPVLDGWGVLEALRGRPDSPPVIVVSASDSAANVERARELGVAAYVTKPFNLPALVQLVATVVQRRTAPDRGAAHPAG